MRNPNQKLNPISLDEGGCPAEDAPIVKLSQESNMSHRTVSQSRRPAIGSWRLHPGHAMSLRPRRAAVLRIYCGRVWVTLSQPAGTTPETAGDRFLGPGDVLIVPAGARLVMEPLAPPQETQPVHFDWSDARAAALPGRFAREVASPARELAAALGLAASALGRVLRGLLGYSEYLVAGWRAATAAASASRAQGAISAGDSSASSGGVWYCRRWVLPRVSYSKGLAPLARKCGAVCAFVLRNSASQAMRATFRPSTDKP